MPEGDTIHKLAAALAPLWIGRVPHRIALNGADERRLSGQRIAAVTARGKHLLVEFGPGLLLRTHLGMYGSWHRYRVAERWKKPRWQASAVIEIGNEVYVCFNAKECEIVRSDGVRDRTLKNRLGQDLAASGLDLSAVPGRARAFCEPDTPIADVLLDQRIACGIGNVYKSEVLFLLHIRPLTPIEALSDGELRGLYRTGAELLQRNLRSGPRVTRFENDAAGVLWVYRRTGQPCFVCGTPVRSQRCGKHWRSSYWCPACQPDRT